jgi:hypothetical protein
MRLWFFMASLVLAQETGKGADPIPDHLRAEIAIAQRDYLLAQKQLETTFLIVKEKIAQAEKLCASQNRALDGVKLLCMETKQP